MQDRKKAIRPLVLREAVLHCNHQGVRGSEQLLKILVNNCTRDVAFECALELADEDQQRRAAIGSFLLHFLPSFPPSRELTRKIKEKCVAYRGEKPPYFTTYDKLNSILADQLSRCTFSSLPKSDALSHNQTFEDMFQNPNYLTKFSLQTSVERSEKGFTSIRIHQWSRAQIESAAMHKNANKDYTKEVDLTFTRCPDYINQFPLECYEELVNQQISILTNFSDNYRTNPSVLRATNFLIKQICDGYVSKIPFGKPYSLFRSISVCYLPTFFLMMESDYLCVRSHVYDFFLTLGAHLQIVDTKNAYDCTGALENELVWMLFNILKRQAVIKTQDELIWSAAAKCTLAIVPRPFRHLIDSRALLKFLKIPKLAEKNPSTFTIFSEAFVRSLLTDKRLGVKPHDNLTIDKEAFSSLGNSGLAEIIGLYRNSFTVGARFSYFQFLFSYTAQKVRSTPKESQKDSSTIALPQSLQHCFKELVSLEFFWYLHPLFFYQSHRVTSELANEIIFDLNFKELRENRTVIMAMVQEILLVMAEDSALPKDIMQDFDSSATTGPSLMVVAEDVVGTVPRLLREPDIDVKTYRIAWQLAFLTLRIIKERLGDARGELLADRLISQIVDYDEVTDEQVKYRIRKVCPDLIYSLELLSRTHPSQGTKPLDSILEGFLFLKSAPLTSLLPQLVLVFRFFMEFFSFRNGSILNSPESSNVASLILNGVLLVPSTVLQSIGTRNLWAIYRVLVCDQSQSVCNDRHVIMSLLSSLETSTEMHCVRMWETVMMDLYPPVALIGALRVVQIYKKHSPNPPVEVNERSENLYAQAVNLIYGHGSETGSRQ